MDDVKCKLEVGMMGGRAVGQGMQIVFWKNQEMGFFFSFFAAPRKSPANTWTLAPQDRLLPSGNVR